MASKPPIKSAAADGNALQRFWARRKTKHAAKKRRLAQMPRGKRYARRAAIIGTWLLGVCAFFLVLTLVLFYTLSNVPRPESLPLPQVAVIQYSDGSTLARIGTQDRQTVPLAKVPQAVRFDVLAAEDRNFYSEPGFSIKGTLRAALSDLTGGDTQGGSGITQQYVKNAYLSADRTLSRKLKELMISVKLAREYPKDKILEFYLNTVYFGRGVYGIEAASKAFFGLDVSKLNVAQGAVLAALLRDPGYYDPAENPQAAKDRWQFVIDGMVATHHLTQAQADALQYPAVKQPKGTRLGVEGPKALLVNRVLAELQAHGITEAEINTRGLIIRTTIDKKAQAAAVDAIHQTFGDLTKQQKNLKNALVAINPANGGVLAYYGGPNGTGYDGKDDYYDYAGIGARPPGSSFKPYTLATVLTQTVKKTKGKKPLAINSYVDGSYCVTIEGRKICNDPGDESLSSKSVTIANAMKWSLNTTFDQLAEEAGPPNVAATAHAMGIPAQDGDGKPTLVSADGQTGFGIGIGDYAVRPIDQATGYATLADGGVRHVTHFISRVTDSDGGLIYKFKDDAAQALDPKVANDVTLTLEPVASWSHVALDGGRTSAAKTGTEGIYQDNKGNNSDAWMAGFTPQVAAVVWTGSGNSTEPIYNSYGSPEYGSDLPAHTWKLFLDTYLQGRPDAPMPTHQMITGGENAATPPPSSTSTSQTPTPTHATTSPAPSTSTVRIPTPTPTPTRTPTPTPIRTTPKPTLTPSSTCSSGLVRTCPTPTATAS